MNSQLENKAIKRNSILLRLESKIPQDKLFKYLMDDKLKILSSINLISGISSQSVE